MKNYTNSCTISSESLSIRLPNSYTTLVASAHCGLYLMIRKTAKLEGQLMFSSITLLVY